MTKDIKLKIEKCKELGQYNPIADIFYISINQYFWKNKEQNKLKELLPNWKHVHKINLNNQKDYINYISITSVGNEYDTKYDMI